MLHMKISFGQQKSIIECQRFVQNIFHVWGPVFLFIFYLSIYTYNQPTYIFLNPSSKTYSTSNPCCDDTVNNMA